MQTLSKNIFYAYLFIILCGIETLFALDTQEVISKITEIIQNHPNVTTGIEIYSLKNDQLLFAHRPYQLMIPASNTKLFTSAYALSTLGTEYQFGTQFIAEQSIKDGILNGDLYLKPSGDPSFTSQDLDQLVTSLQQRGLQHIKGNISIIDTEFDDECFAPGVCMDDLGTAYCNPVKSCVIDHKAATLCPVNVVNFTDTKKFENMFFDINSVLRFLLQKYGIKFSGSINFTYSEPLEGITLAEHRSAPLIELVAHLLKNSDNLYADCLFKHVGAYQGHKPSSWQLSRSFMQEFLCNELMVNPTAAQIIDGSGLSRYTLISAHQIVSLLRWIYAQSFFPDFMNALAIAGVDGTLKKRMVDISPNVKAKTGTLGNVSSLSGYIETEDDHIAFAIINNGYISTSIYNPPCKTEIEDAICRLLAV